MERLNYKTLTKKIIEVISSKKGEDIVTYDVKKMTSFTDYLIIATVTSKVQMEAVIKELVHELKIKPNHIEGKGLSGWMLIDYGGVVVNMFLPEVREFYRLERLWGDGQILTI